jgi:hypothetical protein
MRERRLNLEKYWPSDGPLRKVAWSLLHPDLSGAPFSTVFKPNYH